MLDFYCQTVISTPLLQCCLHGISMSSGLISHTHRRGNAQCPWLLLCPLLAWLTWKQTLKWQYMSVICDLCLLLLNIDFMVFICCRLCASLLKTEFSQGCYCMSCQKKRFFFFYFISSCCCQNIKNITSCSPGDFSCERATLHCVLRPAGFG